MAVERVGALSWLPSAPVDWSDRLRALGDLLDSADVGSGADLDSMGTALRALAGFDLTDAARIRLQRLVARVVASPLTPTHFRRFRLGIVASRNIDVLARALPSAGASRGLLVECIAAPYDAIARFAFGHAAPFDAAAFDAVLVMTDVETFPPATPLLDEPSEASRVDAALDLLSRLVSAVRVHCRCPAIVATLPPCHGAVSSADRAVAGTTSRFVARLNEGIVKGAHAGSWYLWDLESLASEIGLSAWFDPIRHFQAKVPFAVELAPRVAHSLSALLAAFAGKAGRAIVLDLDDTVWGGVVGDDGIEGLVLGQNSTTGEAFVAFQRFVLELHARGVVVAVCSKNEDAVAREPFRTHPEMVLREEHIAVFQASWDDKATSLVAIADALNLGLESLVFVDDNPAERSRVRRSLPLVTVPEVGDDPAYFARRIRECGAFEMLPPTAEDLQRTQTHAAEARRARVRETIGDYDDYLRSLRMRMQVSPFDEESVRRLAQLVNKSNQFNLTTRRYTEEDIRRMSRDPSLVCWQGLLTDDFGSHGIVAVVIVRKADDAWTIDSWLQSCRVLERGVEDALMDLLIRTARDQGVRRIRGGYRPTSRNAMVSGFFLKQGFRLSGSDPASSTQYFELEIEGSPSRKSCIVVSGPHPPSSTGA